MFRRFIVLSALGCLLLPAIASAQFPWSRQGEYLYREQMQRGYYGGQYATPPAVETSRSFYPAAPMADRVWMEVTVPASAKIRFEGAETRQTGAHREFVSPALSTGVYQYEIQASWMENGKEISQRRTFPVRPGDAIHIRIGHDGIKVTPQD